MNIMNIQTTLTKEKQDEMIQKIEETLNKLKNDEEEIDTNLIEVLDTGNLTFQSIQKMFIVSFNQIEELISINKTFFEKFDFIPHIRIEACEIALKK